MAKNKFLDKKWQKVHLKKIKERAGNRYTPELNIDLPIADIFDGISRTESFYTAIRGHYGRLNRKFSRVSQKYENEEIQKLYKNLKSDRGLILWTQFAMMS
jgi:ribosome-associated translation inhibitor RaiA